MALQAEGSWGGVGLGCELQGPEVSKWSRGHWVSCRPPGAKQQEALHWSWEGLGAGTLRGWSRGSWGQRLCSPLQKWLPHRYVTSYPCETHKQSSSVALWQFTVYRCGTYRDSSCRKSCVATTHLETPGYPAQWLVCRLQDQATCALEGSAGGHYVHSPSLPMK